MADTYLFTDGSFHPQTKMGVGALLVLSKGEFDETKTGDLFTIRTKVMEEAKTIAHVELMTALWALSEPGLAQGVTLFTDSEMILKLPERRERLEASAFESKRTGQSLANAELYEEFFAAFDALRPTLKWVKGHSRPEEQDEFQRVFSFVDRAARRSLRDHLGLH